MELDIRGWRQSSNQESPDHYYPNAGTYQVMPGNCDGYVHLPNKVDTAYGDH